MCQYGRFSIIRSHMCMCTLSLLRYIYKLADLHKEQNSYVEAGYTLLLHAELLQVCAFQLTVLIELYGIVHA